MRELESKEIQEVTGGISANAAFWTELNWDNVTGAVFNIDSITFNTTFNTNFLNDWFSNWF